MRKGRVFISYRRDDAAGYARALYDELVRRFSDERVFMDVDDIGAGQPFDDVIRQAAGEAQVLLVLIGRRWAGEPGVKPSRLHEAGDYVRKEIVAALSRHAHIIPVLLDGAAMPGQDELPDAIAPLAQRQAMEMSNTRFATDMERLLAAVHDALGEPRPSPTAFGWHWKRMLLLAAAGGLAAGLVVGASYFFLPASPRPAINGDWQAEVSYDWPGAQHVERFTFTGDAAELTGSASFLGVGRGIEQGSVEADGIRFTTRTSEMAGGATIEQVHRYRGTLHEGEIRFTMQTEGGASPHVPITFTARRTTP